jgi:hypothetical protein
MLPGKESPDLADLQQQRHDKQRPLTLPGQGNKQPEEGAQWLG